VGVALAVPLTAAGCSSSDSSATTTTAASTTSTTSSAVQTAKVRALQIALAALGCYSGRIDGVQGSATAQAIRSFQKAAGLTVDGIYGTATESQALADVKAGKKICSSSTTTSTTGTSTTTTTKPSGTTTTTKPSGTTTSTTSTTTSTTAPPSTKTLPA
jgi:peptidoglycan hydrolase-like protein with peptidoglycan-binding domain